MDINSNIGFYRMMTLGSQIDAMINSKLNIFIEKISNQYSIDESQLRDIWKTVEKLSNDGLKTIKKKNKKSAYQYFAEEYRKILLQNDPTLKFGMISSKISEKWKSMTLDEKNQYNKKSPSPLNPDDKNDYKNKNMNELKKLCKDRGLKIAGNKNQLIKRLLESDDNLKKNNISIDNNISTPIYDNHTSISIKSPIFNDNTTLPQLSRKLFNDINASPIEKDSISIIHSSPSSLSSKSLSSKSTPQKPVLSSLKIEELRNICKTHKISSKGNKQVLIQNILNANIDY